MEERNVLFCVGTDQQSTAQAVHSQAEYAIPSEDLQ